ncbi:MAG: DNA-3-methyladenine glycosylase [Oscillospiraceae bacterium]
MKLGRDFFMQDTKKVAKQLLGKKLWHITQEGITAGIIVETEAYLGERDGAAHTHRGKSERTRVAYEDSGRAYIYLIYGMYCCFNITSGERDVPEMVLLRALEPCEGTEVMMLRRNTDRVVNLCSGPGKLCKALQITRDMYGHDLCESETFFITDDGFRPKGIAVSRRIGIDYAKEAREYPLRFFIKDNKYVSKVLKTK